MRNRIHNSSNPYQVYDKYPRALCVCSAGLLRSPTTAVVLAGDDYKYNTRAVGADSGHALVPLDPVHLVWADVIVFAERCHFDLAKAEERIQSKNPELKWEDSIMSNKPVYILNIPDQYEYRHPTLVAEIKDRFKQALKQADGATSGVFEVPRSPSMYS